MLGQLGAILEQLGDKMRPKSAKISQDGAQEHEDEARKAKGDGRESPGKAGTRNAERRNALMRRSCSFTGVPLPTPFWKAQTWGGGFPDPCNLTL